MTNKIVDLTDAKAMKRMGLPLDTPVEHRFFSAEYTKHWVKLMQAYEDFMRVIIKFLDSTTVPQLKRVNRRFNKLILVVLAQPVLKDEHEMALLIWFKQQRAFPFLRYWEGVLDAVEEGTAVTISADDVPLWEEETQMQ